MSAKPSEQEKIAYLEERISYELVMLNYTFMRLLTSSVTTANEQLELNAHLELFGVHARNLVAFLSGKSAGDVRSAADYVADFEVPGNTRPQQTLVKLEKQILRVTVLRATDPQEKFNADYARKLYAWIVPAILKFHDQLGPSYRASFKIPEAVETATSVKNWAD